MQHRSCLYITWLLRGGVTIFDSCAADHLMKSPRSCPSIFAYSKRSKLEAQKAGERGYAFCLSTNDFSDGD